MPLLRRRSSRSTQLAKADPPQEREAHPAPQVFTGSTILPDEGAASRIDSAGDVDPNVKRYGEAGNPGGAGGFGGAGTK